MRFLREYTRWREDPEQESVIHADILTSAIHIWVDRSEGFVSLNSLELSPDEARLIGVRLIEGASLADGEMSIRAAVRVDRVETSE